MTETSKDAIFDPTRLLVMSDGNFPFVRDVIKEFEKMMTGKLADLLKIMLGGDLQALAAVAHSIKGAAADIGAEQLRAAADQLEAAGNSGVFTEVERCMAQLRKEYDELIRYCRKMNLL